VQDCSKWAEAHGLSRSSTSNFRTTLGFTAELICTFGSKMQPIPLLQSSKISTTRSLVNQLGEIDCLKECVVMSLAFCAWHMGMGEFRADHAKSSGFLTTGVIFKSQF
jgi:hypothetical protein